MACRIEFDDKTGRHRITVGDVDIGLVVVQLGVEFPRSEDLLFFRGPLLLHKLFRLQNGMVKGNERFDERGARGQVKRRKELTQPQDKGVHDFGREVKELGGHGGRERALETCEWNEGLG